jgi:hypothetical protein
MGSRSGTVIKTGVPCWQMSSKTSPKRDLAVGEPGTIKSLKTMKVTKRKNSRWTLVQRTIKEREMAISRKRSTILLDLSSKIKTKHMSREGTVREPFLKNVITQAETKKRKGVELMLPTTKGQTLPMLTKMVPKGGTLTTMRKKRNIKAKMEIITLISQIFTKKKKKYNRFQTICKTNLLKKS